ncbi:MAG: M48 family metallopeptidase [Gemmatimonadetes bacterium]|nr:M48 family metallopeptidase [Gemmatimonadota bacterium]
MKKISLILIIALTMSCAVINKLNLLTSEQEVELGRQASREVERSVRLYRDPVVRTYIDSLGQALVRASRLSQFRYYFKVVDAPEVNAFALPGGFIYVNLGLIKAAETESELVGVIGHEIGHVEMHHGAKNISRHYGLAVVVELISGGEDTSLGREIAGQLAGFGGGVYLLKYGRAAERESDRFAVHCLVKAGVDPEGIARFFETLLKLQKSEPKGVEKWFATHPPTQSRVDFVRSEIAKLPNTAGLRKTSARFKQIRARVGGGKDR